MRALIQEICLTKTTKIATKTSKSVHFRFEHIQFLTPKKAYVLRQT